VSYNGGASLLFFEELGGCFDCSFLEEEADDLGFLVQTPEYRF
jgi:hypothetical protein